VAGLQEYLPIYWDRAWLTDGLEARERQDKSTSAANSANKQATIDARKKKEADIEAKLTKPKPSSTTTR
jgi:hypothetical protein